jgi:hypothetical protein
VSRTPRSRLLAAATGYATGVERGAREIVFKTVLRLVVALEIERSELMREFGAHARERS